MAAAPSTSWVAPTDPNDARAFQKFREYLRIKTVSHPAAGGAYAEAAVFLSEYAASFGLKTEIVQLAAGKPMVLMSYEGSSPDQPSILLNSHMDVVPAVTEKWDWEPFGGDVNERGDIFGRGTQDMKSVTIQMIEAVGRLRARGVALPRTVHLSVVPDEEIGGVEGMQAFLKCEQFKKLNVGLALDEGLANPTDTFTVFYGERAVWWVDVTATGQAGHGSRFVEGTAVPKLLRAIEKFLNFREEQYSRLQTECHCGKTLGDFTSINLTILRAGTVHNVIPTEAMAGFDIRIPPHVSLDDFRARLDEWTAEAGVSYQFCNYTNANRSTPLTDNFWWDSFSASMTRQGLTIKPEIFPAASDSRFLRLLNIPAFGFSPINNTPILLHDHNEFLNASVFLRGIPILETLVSDLASTVAPSS